MNELISAATSLQQEQQQPDQDKQQQHQQQQQQSQQQQDTTHSSTSPSYYQLFLPQPIPLPTPHSLLMQRGVGAGAAAFGAGMPMTSTATPIIAVSSGIEPFPERLHRLLREVEFMGRVDVISFVRCQLPKTRNRCEEINAEVDAFCIHQPDAFFRDIVPRYFKQSRLASFRRQLNLYGFELLYSQNNSNTNKDTNANGKEMGGHHKLTYFHELFSRDRPELCRRIRRVTPNNNSSKSSSSDSIQKGAKSTDKGIINNNNNNTSNQASSGVATTTTKEGHSRSCSNRITQTAVASAVAADSFGSTVTADAAMISSSRIPDECTL